MTIRFAKAYLNLVLSGLAFSAMSVADTSAWAAPGYHAERLRVTVRPAHAGPLLAGPACDRREVGACQSEARSRAITCDVFSDRLGCADTVLAAQSACLRQTGCY